VEPQIVEKGTFAVMGVQSASPFETDDFETIWEEYMAHHEEVEPYSTDGAHYGVTFPGEEEGVLEYLAGMATEGVEEAPEGLVLREVPGGRYAVFGCTVAAIHDTYEHIFHEWQPPAGSEVDSSRVGFERYEPGTASGESPVSIYVPVTAPRPAGGGGTGAG
jgi:predicted transcriptional regulator YdeE